MRFHDMTSSQPSYMYVPTLGLATQGFNQRAIFNFQPQAAVGGGRTSARHRSHPGGSALPYLSARFKSRVRTCTYLYSTRSCRFLVRLLSVEAELAAPLSKVRLLSLSGTSTTNTCRIMVCSVCFLEKPHEEEV